MWRSANPAIVKAWYKIQNAAINAVETGEPDYARYCHS